MEKEEDDDSSSTSCIVNCHNRLISLGNDLYILGNGGSCVAYENSTEIWAGYPYEKDIDTIPLLEKARTIKSTDSVIFLTHCPPSSLPTSVYRSSKSDFPIQTGSDTLSEFISQLVAMVGICPIVRF